jgi:DNA polymerase I-like protein with 3'-5' exonuclease and polymerase domains
MNDLNQALNYQDQGTGADILVRAIADLPTAIAAMMRMVEFVGDPLDWLAAKDGMGRKQLKEQFGEERQAAKAANFGLLYGMQAAGLHDYGVTDFGLSWTLEEASDTRRAWFELYPDFGRM